MDNSVIRFARSLLRDTSAIAMMEMALVLPVLVTLCVAGIELSNLSMAYLRVNGIAIQTADNAARVRTSIDEADVLDIFQGARLMGANIDFAARGRIILSSIEPIMNTATPPAVVNQYLRWQRCMGANAANSTHGAEGDGATGTAQATGYGPAGKPKIVAAANTAVMLTEVVYNYKPLMTPDWFGNVTIRASQSVTVRERSDQVIKNGNNLTTAQKALCSNAHTA